MEDYSLDDSFPSSPPEYRIESPPLTYHQDSVEACNRRAIERFSTRGPAAAARMRGPFPLSTNTSLKGLRSSMDTLGRLSDDGNSFTKQVDAANTSRQAGLYPSHSFKRGQDQPASHSTSSTLSIRRKSAHPNLRGPYDSAANSIRLRRMNPFLSGMSIPDFNTRLSGNEFKPREPTHYPAGHILNPPTGLRRTRTTIPEGSRTARTTMPEQNRATRATMPEASRTLNHRRSMVDDPKENFSTFKTMSSALLERKGVQWENVVIGYNKMSPKEPLTVSQAKEIWNTLPHVTVLPGDDNEDDDTCASEMDDYNLELHCYTSDSGGESTYTVAGDTSSEDELVNEDKVKAPKLQAKRVTPQFHEPMQQDQPSSKSRSLPKARAKKAYTPAQERWLLRIMPTVMKDGKKLSNSSWKAVQELFFNEFHELKLMDSLMEAWATVQKKHEQALLNTFQQ